MKNIKNELKCKIGRLFLLGILKIHIYQKIPSLKKTCLKIGIFLFTLIQLAEYMCCVLKQIKKERCGLLVSAM
jgi:hypothetical protein